MSEASELKMLFARYYYPDEPLGPKHEDFKQRMSLRCTPFNGGDLEVDGWVVCAMGSPPKGTMVIFGGGCRKLSAFHIYGGARQIDLSSEMGVVQAFYDSHLKDKVSAVTIP
jgi:hypothetical protein